MTKNKDAAITRRIDPQLMMLMMHAAMESPDREDGDNDIDLSSALIGRRNNDSIIMRIDSRVEHQVVYKVGASWKNHDVCHKQSEPGAVATTRCTADLSADSNSLINGVCGSVLEFCIESETFMVNVRRGIYIEFLRYIDLMAMGTFKSVYCKKLDKPAISRVSDAISEKYRDMTGYVYSIKCIDDRK